MVNIADRIQYIRKSKGISQEQLADAVGVSRQAVSKWESGQNFPDVNMIIALSDYFDVTTDYILKGKEAPVKNPRNDWGKILPIVSTALNYIGFIIMLIDSLLSWKYCVFAMSTAMIVYKVVSIAFMILGTTVFCVSLKSDKENKGEKIRSFLRINIVAYAVIVALIVYLTELPYMWPWIVYVIVVVVAEIILFKKKKK